MDNAFSYIKANNGIDTEASYPYTAEDGSCKFSAANVGATCTGIKFRPEQSVCHILILLSKQDINFSELLSKFRYWYYHDC